jgi:tetratricopeptide (TPR) repeat protein
MKLGNAYYSLEDYSKAIEYHTQDLTIAKEVGDRAGEGRAYGNLGNAYKSLGDLSKAIEHHTQDLEIMIAKAMDDRAGEVKAYGNSATRIIRSGSIPSLYRAPHAGPDDCKGVGRPGGEGQGVREPRQRV